MNANTSKLIKAVISWVIVLWIVRVFLTSLPYKFTGHPDTQHIFGTIGGWMRDLLGAFIGGWFEVYGAFAVGSFELLTSIVLLLPAVLWVIGKLGGGGMRAGARAKWHARGGLMAAVVMAGAVFFHLFTPLGVEVLHQGKSDGGSLFYAAVSILVGGIVLFLLNRSR